ncbi:MAG: TonB-dependent receptor plug domain-containing protein, partial [Prevotellaceae bacterium]|nr:TonB-dependent receptor plug domain-containing protein [Prevotellaceae bacterium]
MTNLFHFVGTHKHFPTFLPLFFALLLGANAAAAQSGVSIAGKVLDDRTKSVAVGATVKVAGSALGAIVGADGSFGFTVRALPVSLEVSLLGYRTLELDVYEAPAEPLLIYLVEDFNALSEVVVVGYGTQKRNEITGSLASVPLANLQQASATPSFDNLLSGAVAGVHVTQSSGQPGASSSIRIRGGNSITGGNEPLYVIDGQIMYNNNAATSAGVGYAGAGLNALATINAADIESIEVLKDASATAIYGSRGANGVILVSTKKGAGKDRITYAGSAGQSVVGKKLDLLNGREWALLRNDII